MYGNGVMANSLAWWDRKYLFHTEDPPCRLHPNLSLLITQPMYNQIGELILCFNLAVINYGYYNMSYRFT